MPTNDAAKKWMHFCSGYEWTLFKAVYKFRTIFLFWRCPLVGCSFQQHLRMPDGENKSFSTDLRHLTLFLISRKALIPIWIPCSDKEDCFWIMSYFKSIKRFRIINKQLHLCNLLSLLICKLATLFAKNTDIYCSSVTYNIVAYVVEIFKILRHTLLWVGT